MRRSLISLALFVLGACGATPRAPDGWKSVTMKDEMDGSLTYRAALRSDERPSTSLIIQCEKDTAKVLLFAPQAFTYSPDSRMMRVKIDSDSARRLGWFVANDQAQLDPSENVREIVAGWAEPKRILIEYSDAGGDMHIAHFESNGLKVVRDSIAKHCKITLR
jgi:hypothetical protein